jgi:hypothetical protein
MEKPSDPSGYPTRGSGKNDKFKEKLLRKRRTYARYFERGLSKIDAALRRVAVAREVKQGMKASVTAGKITAPNLELASRGGVAAIARESFGKEKQNLKKYTKRVVDRAVSSAYRKARRLISWEEATRKKEEKERASVFRHNLQEREALFNRLGPKAFDEFLRREEREKKRIIVPCTWQIDGLGRAVCRSHSGPVSETTPLPENLITPSQREKRFRKWSVKTGRATSDGTFKGLRR